MIENYKNEYLKEYSTIDEAIIELKEFVNNDYTYERYLKDKTYKPDETEILNINHIKAIVKLIEQFKNIREKEYKNIRKERENE